MFSYRREIVLRSSASHDYLVCGMPKKSEICIFECTVGAGVWTRHAGFPEHLTNACDGRRAL